MKNIIPCFKEWKNPVSSFFITLIILLALYIVMSMAPFGFNSLAATDAEIQYLDFFSYGKGILTGVNNPLYTFNKSLGSNVWAVVAYYLLSPFNLIILLFNQFQLNIYYDILVLIKLSLCSATMAFYLERRFKSLARIFILLLAASFGLMQYNLEQAKNIMWLDPIYMLPWMLWGTYKIQQGKGILFLTIVIARKKII